MSIETYTLKFDAQQGWIKVKIFKPTQVDLSTLPQVLDKKRKSKSFKQLKFKRDKWNTKSSASKNTSFDNTQQFTNGRFV